MKCIEFWFVFYITNYQIFKRNNDVLVNLIFLNQMLAQSFTFNLGEKAKRIIRKCRIQIHNPHNS